MHDIDIHYAGGISMHITGLTDEAIEELVEWLDDDNNKKTLKLDFPNHNKTSCFRKELILSVDII